MRSHRSDAANVGILKMVAVFAVSVTERSEGREEGAARAKANNEGWKSSAVEFLMIWPIVLDWVSTNVSEQLPGEVESFRRLCVVRKTRRLHVLSEARLHQHKLVYGNEFLFRVVHCLDVRLYLT